MAANTGGGFDPAKPLILLILIATFVAAGFAFRFWSEYREWDRVLLRDLQDWRSYDSESDPERLQTKSMSVRERMLEISQEINTLPPEVLDAGAGDMYDGIGSFLEGLANKNGVRISAQTERVDSRSGIEEKKFTFEVSGSTRSQVTTFLYDAETQRPILKCMEIANFRQSDPKSDDFEHWDCRVTMAYRRALDQDN